MQLLHARRWINHNTSQLSQIAYVCLYFDQPLDLQRKDQRIAYNIQNKAIEMVLFILLKKHWDVSKSVIKGHVSVKYFLN